MDLDEAVRAIWERELKKLPLEMALEKIYYEIIATTIRDEEIRAMAIPKYLISKPEELHIKEEL